MSNLVASVTLPGSATGVPNTDVRAGSIGALDLIQCETNQLFIINKRGRELHWPVASSVFPTIDCINKTEVAQARVANDLETVVDVDDSTIRTQEFNAVDGPPPFPPQFTKLWDNIQSGCEDVWATCDTSLTVQNNVGPPFFSEGLL